MLTVGAPVTTTTPTTTPTFHTFNDTLLQPTAAALVGNQSLDVALGDQPGPPFREGTPTFPDFWKGSTQRPLYITNRHGKYLEMWPNGHTRGVSEKNSFCVFMLISHYASVVMKGLVSDKFLCMNPQTSELYNRSQVHSDCYIQEAGRNGSGFIVYNFKECRTPENKKCYLGMYRNGTMRAGNQARQSQDTAQWLTVEVKPEDEKNAEDEKETIRKQGGWTAPTTTPSPPTPRPVSEKEQRRKRVKRWCRNLSVIRKKPNKFVKRCKRDCEILERMIADPERSMRHCLISLVRRRIRNKAEKRGEQMLDDETLKKKSRAQAQRLWPRREEIFRRLRHLRRCNLKHRRRPGKTKYSCTKQELRRHKRKRLARKSQSKSPTTPSGSSASSGSRSNPRSKRRRHRHQLRRGGRKRHKQEEGGVKSRHSETSARDRDAEREYESKSRLLTTLTPS